MKQLRYILPVLITCLLASGALSADPFPGILGDDFDANEERDARAVEEFLASKRAILVADKGGSLSIGGEVRFEWQYKEEAHNNKNYIGTSSRLRTEKDFTLWGNHNFDVEVNLYFDYSTECTWARVKIEFDNDAGVSKCNNIFSKSKLDEKVDVTNVVDGLERDINASGTCGKLCVEQAYFGFNVFDDGCSRLDIEIGRRALSNVFESRLQFGNRFDGVLAKYSNTYENVGDYYIYGGVFVIDEVVDWYGGAVEFGLLDMMCTGLDLRYSFINYRNRTSSREGVYNPNSYFHRSYEFRNSQISFVYNVSNECWSVQNTKIYGGVIYNHAARKREASGFKRENVAFYLGARLGKVKCEGDWSIDFNYQWVQAQAIQECDNNGVGRGNAAHVSWISDRAFGKGNYHGGLIEGVYAISNNISIVGEVEYAEEIKRSIGQKLHFFKSEIELIYAF